MLIHFFNACSYRFERFKKFNYKNDIRFPSQLSAVLCYNTYKSNVYELMLCDKQSQVNAFEKKRVSQYMSFKNILHPYTFILLSVTLVFLFISLAVQTTKSTPYLQPLTQPPLSTSHVVRKHHRHSTSIEMNKPTPTVLYMQCKHMYVNMHWKHLNHQTFNVRVKNLILDMMQVGTWSMSVCE